MWQVSKVWPLLKKEVGIAVSFDCLNICIGRKRLIKQ